MCTVSTQPRRRRDSMKRNFDLLAGVLLVVGGLNWGLVAVAKFDLVAWIVGLSFGQTNAASRVVYGLVGLAAVYQIAQQASIRRRWSRDDRLAHACPPDRDRHTPTTREGDSHEDPHHPPRRGA